uniref:CCN family member 3 n=1 Tax=Sus scrofa TaxID=9823 RepID=A0A8D1UJN9_PIG
MATPGSFHSHPADPPRLLPELQPTGLCASQERAIKPARWRWGEPSPTWSGTSRTNLRPGKSCESGRTKPEHAESAEPAPRSAQAVPLPGFPAPPSPGTAIEGDNCVFDGVIYQSGETFQPSCKYQCACQDGQVGCVPRCEEDLLLPQPDCPAPRKVKVPGECCEKWICDSNETGTLGDLQTLPAYRTEATVGVAISDSGTNCIEQTTEWSACSKSCGMGFSTRVTNRNPHCEMVKQTRLCLVRPCDQEHTQPTDKKGKKCLRTTKSLKAIHLQFENCTSLHTYRPRFCGVCSDGRCCTPHSTKTIRVQFRCSPGKTIQKPVMVIGTCTCHNNCPHNNASFLQDLKPNTSRGEM